MFACLLVAQYDTYNVAYTYFGDITAKKIGIASHVWYIKYCFSFRRSHIMYYLKLSVCV